MKNIHLFETKNAYDTAKSGLILPRVSYIKENKDVKYNPTFDANGHDFVEIAGIKWATMNVGASSSTDAGLYFQWGDTQGYTSGQVGTSKEQKMFSWNDYTKFTTDGGTTFKKYNGTDNNTVLTSDDDAVHANWGGSWRMPTKQEFKKLLNSTSVTKTWKTGYNGTNVAGYKFHDNNSNDTLFLPVCGCALDGEVRSAGVYGYYWLNSLYSDNVGNAYTLFFGSINANVNLGGRCSGRCVRGVLAEN